MEHSPTPPTRHCGREGLRFVNPRHPPGTQSGPPELAGGSQGGECRPVQFSCFPRPTSSVQLFSLRPVSADLDQGGDIWWNTAQRPQVATMVAKDSALSIPDTRPAHSQDLLNWPEVENN